MTDAWDDEDRAIARALDVPFGDGPVDERALEDYRRVVAELPVDEVTPPAELENRTISAALARRPAAATWLPAAHDRHRSRARIVALAAVTVAAAIVIGVLVTTRESSTRPQPVAVAGGHVVPVASSTPNRSRLLHAPGARTGSFGGGGSVVLAGDGTGALFDLVTTSKVVIELVTANDHVAIGSAAPVDGKVAFSVQHPELVVAVRLTFPNGNEIADARLRPS